MTEQDMALPPITKTPHGSHLATVGGAGAILLWSTTIAVTRNLSEQLGPVTAAAGVYGVGGVAALVSLLRRGGKRQRIRQLPARYLVGCGGLSVGYTLLLYLAVGSAESRQQVLEVGLLNYLWPTMTLLLSLVFIGHRANWLLIPGTVLAFFGVSLVVTQGGSVSWHSLSASLSGNPGAYSLAFAAAVFWSMYSILTRRWAGGREEGAVVMFLPITAVALLLIGCFVDEPREWSRRSWAEVLFLGVATYLAYTLWDGAMRRGNVVMVVAGSYLTPFFSTIVSCLYLSVAPDPRLWVGCGILVLGSMLSWWSVSRA